MQYKTKYFLIEDNYSFLAEKKIDPDSFDEIANEISEELNAEIPTDNLIPVFIIEGVSQSYDNKIYVCGNSDYDRDYFKMLFKHELTHLITFTWGIAPIIFWEGIPVYFADNQYRDNSYHKYSKAFINNGVLYNLKYFIEGHKYLGRRFDFRIDIECGSFVGFLYEKYGADKLREVFQNYHHPSPEEPFNGANTVLEKVYSKKLSDLEKDWIKFLEDEIESDSAIEEKIKNKKFYKRIPIKSIHCKFCYFPMEKKEMICPTCQGDNKIKVLVK